MNSNYELLEKEEHRAEKHFCNGVASLLIAGTVISFVIGLVLLALYFTDHQLTPLAPEQISSGIQMMLAIFAAILATSIATANRQSPIEIPTEDSATEAQYFAERLVTNRKLRNLSLFLGKMNVAIGELLLINLCWAYCCDEIKDASGPELILAMLMITVLGVATVVSATAVHTPEAPSLIEARQAIYPDKRRAKVDFLLNELDQQLGESGAKKQGASTRTYPQIIRYLCRWRNLKFIQRNWRVFEFIQRHCLLLLAILSAALTFPPLEVFKQVDSTKNWIIFAVPFVAIHLSSAVLSRLDWERICTSLNSDRNWFAKEAKKIRRKQKWPLSATVITLLIGLIVRGCLPTGAIREILGAFLALVSVFVIPGCLSAFVWSIQFQTQTGLLTAGAPGKIERFFINRMHAPHKETTEEQDEPTRETTSAPQPHKRDRIAKAQTTASKILNISKSVGDKTDKKTILAEYEKDGDTVNFSAKFWAKIVSSI